MDTVSVHELQEKMRKDSNMVLIDVRDPLEHKSGTIPGSENIPLDELEQALDTLRKYSAIYVTCSSGTRSSRACTVLREHGLPVVNIEGGVTAWRNAGFDVARSVHARVTMPIMQQTLLAAGVLILLGLLLGYFVHVYFLALTVFVGAGLTFSGATGYCGMTKFLSCMPWNQ